VWLNEVVQGAAELLAYPLRVDTVEVTLDLAPDLPFLWADAHQLHQMLVNLITNAHHAMHATPPPRHLTLATRYDPARRRVLLEVADTGPGIEPAVQARIFEPFFTTKPIGQGTGLGLSLCRGIIEGHGGSIRVETLPEGGTVFRVELPVEAPPLAEVKTQPAEAPGPIRGRAILVVEDEVLIAEMLTDVLSAEGHHVEIAANGTEAVGRIRDRTYDLILSDLRMPEMDGPSFYREIARSRPDLRRRFIFITGDLLTPETRDFLEQTGAPSLSKPFAPEVVCRLIQNALQTD
jgi:CheY-like chemotaxis protein